MNKHEDIDRLFRDALHDHETNPNPDIWNKISEQLDEEKDIVPMASLKKPSFPWVKYAAAACIVIFLGIGYVTLRNDNTPQETAIAQQDSKKVERKEPTSEPLSQSQKRIAFEHTETAVSEQRIQESTNVLTAVRPKDQKPTASIERRQDIMPAQTEVMKEEAVILGKIHYASIEPQQEAQNIAWTEPDKQPVFTSVTEADPIKPLIESFEEEEESMVAGAVRKTSHTVVSSLLNTVGDNISNIAGREVKVSTDDEGSLKIDLGGLLARNRNKKRK